MKQNSLQKLLTRMVFMHCKIRFVALFLFLFLVYCFILHNDPPLSLKCRPTLDPPNRLQHRLHPSNGTPPITF